MLALRTEQRANRFVLRRFQFWEFLRRVLQNFRQQVLDAYGASVARNDENESEVSALTKRAQGSTTGEEWFILAKAFRLRAKLIS